MIKQSVRNRCLYAVWSVYFLISVINPVFSISPNNHGKADQDFKAWAQSHKNLKATDPEAPKGLELAKKRRQEVLDLIKSNPKKALESKIPAGLKKSLSKDIQDQLEETVSGYGTLSAAIATSSDGKSVVVKHFATINGKTYEASVYGRRSQQVSNKKIPLHGIAIGKNLAVHEDSVRVIEPGELNLPDPANYHCPVSGQLSTANNTPVPVDIGGEVVYLCSGGHIMAVNQTLAGAEATAASINGGTTGVKKVLFIRANFPDDLTEPITAGDADTAMAGINQFFIDCSYGKTSMTWTITPLVTLPQTKAWYSSASNGDTQLLADARTAAKNAGYDTAQYDLDCVRYVSIWGFAGMGYVGGKGVWLQSSSAGVASHEFGHNYGLWHANFWATTDGSSIGSGSNNEYGDPFDTMGSARAGIYQFNAYEKNVLGWLPTANLLSVTNSGTYRVTAFDAALGSLKYALLVKKDTERTYWLDKRSLFTANRWENDGIEVHWGKWSQSNGGSQLIDTNPGGSNGTSDSALLLGRTFADTAAGVFITPVSKVSSTPPAMDVVVNIGSFSGNAAPVVSMSASTTSTSVGAAITLTANATDSNGDALAYFWDFGDNTTGLNSSSVSKSWSTTGTKTVTCTVSDMKGGTASGSITINVGTSTNKAPTVATAAAASPSTVTGTTTSLSVLGADDAGEGNLTYTWSASGPAAVGYSSNGTNASKNTTATFTKAGSYSFTATIKDSGGMAVTSSVNVTVNQTLKSVTVSPASATVHQGSTQQFTATGKDQFGAAMATQPAATWLVSGGGTISSTGLFTASTIGGPFTVTATANSISGTASVSVDQAPDTTAPAVSITSPASGTTVSGTFTITASATDNVGVTKVEFYKDSDSTPFATDTTSPYSSSLTMLDLTNGSHVLKAKAYDAAGNSTTSSAVNITVDNSDSTPPNVSITSPSNGAGVSGSITITASASDDVAVEKVEFYKDSDATPFLTDTTSPYSALLNTGTLANGTHTFKAKAYDTSGNSTISSVVTVTVNNADTTAPSVSITSPASGTTVSGTFTITASATDNVGVTKVEFYKDSDTTPFATDTIAPYDVSLNTTPLTNGNHSLRAKAYDAAGNNSNSSAITIDVNNADVTAPTVSITAPASGATVSGTITVGASASDNIGVTKVEFYKDSELSPFSTDTTAPYSALLNTGALSNGSHSLKAKAYDGAGNSTMSGIVTVTVNNADTTAPTVSITSPASGATVSGMITVAATASDNLGVTKVEFYKDTDTTPFMTDTTSPYSASLNTTSLSNGSHSLMAKAYDAAGNSTTSSVVSITISNADTIVPAVSITSPASGSTVSGTITVAASASDNIGVTKVEFYKDSDATPFAMDTIAAYSASLNTTSLTNGGHTLFAKAYDAAGNVSSSTIVGITVNNGSIDTIAPTVTITSPSSDITVRRGASVTVTASASDNVGVTRVEFYINGSLYQADSAAPYSITFNTSKAGHSTSYTVTAKAFDAAGNSKTSAPVTITTSKNATNYQAFWNWYKRHFNWHSHNA